MSEPDQFIKLGTGDFEMGYRVSYAADLFAAVTAELDEMESLPPWCMTDVETDGFHIKKARPFIGAFGWTGRVFIYPTSALNADAVHMLANRIGMLYNHNVNFDLHMLANAARDEEYAHRFKRYSDTMGLCRLVFPAI